MAALMSDHYEGAILDILFLDEGRWTRRSTVSESLDSIEVEKRLEGLGGELLYYSRIELE
jgi:hypothetical protein